MRKTILLITLGLVGLSSQSQALTTTTTYVDKTLDLSKNDSGFTYSYNATTGVLTGYDVSQGVTITFKNKGWNENDLIVFTSAKGTGTPPINGDSTGLLGAADGALKAVWGDHSDNNYCWNNANNTAITAGNITDTIKVEMTKNAGVKVYNASNTQLKHYSGLHSSNADITKTYFNQTYISSIGIKDDASYTYSNADGTWSKTCDADKVINATKGEKKFATNSDIPANLDIVAGGDGYIFFEEWQHGNFNFANNFYIGSRTNGAEAIHFGSDDNDYTTTLTGNIYLVDDAEIKSRGTDTVSIQGKVTDKNVPGSTKTDGGYKLTVTGEGYQFTGDVDVTTLEFGATQKIHSYTGRNTVATFTKGFKADNLILNTNNLITSLATIDGLTTLTVKGADATLDAALDLSTATTLTMDAALALGDNALTLGSMTLAGTLFTTMDTTLETSETLTLFTGVNSLTLGTTSYAGAVDASTVFTNLAAGNYSLVYADSVVALKKGVNDVVPEPTTASLSLLALCGLAMRRRRK